MTENFLHFSEIVAHARHLRSRDELRDYLDRICGDNDALRDRVEESLLESALEAGCWGDAGPLPAADAMACGRRDSDDLSGKVIGTYRLKRWIGQGTYADVYEAESIEGSKGNVAIKLRLTDDLMGEIAFRFRDEQRTHALLNHPNIAQFIDAGTTPEGYDYIVTELLNNESIVAYCNAGQLNIDARLELFKDVCAGVQQAHFSATVHRDLKPGNVLISIIDGRPVPKIIDFGISKQTSRNTTRLAWDTLPTQAIGTPHYMSPEQACGPLTTDTRSDIFSLGAMLYELLTGDTPFPHRIAPQDVIEQLRRSSDTIRFCPPSKALAKALLAEATSPDLSYREDWPAEIQGDLDRIVLQAIDPCYRTRYQTANALLADIDAYQLGMPVQASLGSNNAWRFLLRHRRSLTLAALVLLTLISATVVSTIQAIRATRAERLAESRLGEAVEAKNTARINEKKAIAAAQSEREARLAEERQFRVAQEAEANERIALKETALSRAVTQFLAQELITPSIVGDGPVRDIKMMDVLDHAARGLPERVAGQPIIEAASHEALATAYAGLTNFTAAEKHLQRALALRVSHQGARHIDTLNCQYLLAELYSQMVRYDDAELLLRETLAGHVEQLGSSDARTLNVRYLLGSVLHSRSKFLEARDVCKLTLDLRRKTLGDEHPDTLMSEQCLAAIYSSLGQNEAAERLFEETLERHRRVLGPAHPHTLACQSRLADIYQVRKKYPQAATLYETCLEQQRRKLGDEHHHTLVTELNLASVYWWLGDYQRSEPLFVASLERQRRTLGLGHPITLKTQSNLAKLYHHSGRPADAETLYQETLGAMETHLGPDHEHTIVCMQNLALLYREQGKLPESRDMFTRTHAFSRTHEGEDHRHTLDREVQLAAVHRELGDYSAAEQLLSHALEAMRRVFGESDTSTLSAQYEMAQLFLAQGREQEATELARRTLSARRHALGEKHPDTLETERLLLTIETELVP